MTFNALRAGLAGLWLVPVTLFYGTLIIFSSLLFPDGRWLFPLGRRWSKSVFRVGGVRVSYHGLEHVRATPQAVFMCNHQSMLDFPALALALPDNIRFIAKKSIRWIPFFGWALAASRGCIFIDRRNRAKAILGLQMAAQRIKYGLSMVIFPEGTRSKDGSLLDFKKGPFHLAVVAGIPVVPVAISGAHPLMPAGSLRIHSGEITVRFGPRISVAPETNPLELSREVRSAISQLLCGDVTTLPKRHTGPA